MRGSPTPAPDPNAAKPAAECVNAFTADLYAQLRSGSGNLLVSPYSIATALAMTAAGARENTFAELRTALHLPEAAKLGAAFRALAASVAVLPQWIRSRPELLVANALWAQQDHPWKPEYLALVRDAFAADLFSADFKRAANAVPANVNRWVADHTRGHIQNLLAPGAFDHQTRMVLTNAIYFKARWRSVFEPRDTKPADFFRANGTKVRAATMYQQTHFGLLESDFLQVLKLTYDGNATSMYVLLPRKHDALPELERRLSAQGLAWWTAPENLPSVDVRVWLPKFTFTAPLALGNTLQQMGVQEAFDPVKANFKGITEHPEGLFLNQVVHKAFVAVDEVGTVAAAATMGGAGGYGGPREPPPPPKEFRADHPFVFVIKHEETGAVLFVGRVEDPTR